MIQAVGPGDPGAVGKYRLVGRLGRGGMGQVYLGESPGGRLVAVKVIRAELAGDPDFRARFAREVATARTVSGIYTVPVVDADVDGAQPWLVTAYVEGPSLADAVRDFGPFAPDYDERIYLAPTATLIELVRETPDAVERLLLVGHNPGLEELTLMLAGDEGPLRAEVAVKYPTGTLAERFAPGPLADACARAYARLS